jgi:hypothetical protein
MSFRTEQEMRLVSYTQERYGEMLSLFLLAGLGEEGRAGTRHFTVCEVDWDGNIIRRRLALFPDSEESMLPHGRDPLVFAAILKLLRERGKVNRVRFKLADLTAALGWSDMADSAEAVTGAIGRYYGATLAALPPRGEHYTGESPPSGRGSRILIERETQVTEGEGAGRSYFEVGFHLEFSLWLRHRILLGLDWKRVIAVEILLASSTSLSLSRSLGSSSAHCACSRRTWISIARLIASVFVTPAPLREIFGCVLRPYSATSAAKTGNR